MMRAVAGAAGARDISGGGGGGGEDRPWLACRDLHRAQMTQARVQR